MLRIIILTLFLTDFTVQGAAVHNQEAKATDLKNADSDSKQNNYMTTFYDRVYYIIKEKCLTNANRVKYEEVLDALNRFQTRAYTVSLVENVTGQNFYNDCIKQTENYTAKYLGRLLERLLACLLPQEHYLKQFLMRIHANYYQPYCKYLQVTRDSETARNNASKCIKKFQARPELSPNRVCPNRHKMSLFETNFATEVITKPKVCNGLQILHSCYVEILNIHCPDTPEHNDLQTYLFKNGMSICKKDNIAIEDTGN